MTIFNFTISTKVSFLHFGQNNGNFIITVSLLTFVRVLLPQIGHGTHRESFLCSLTLPPPKNPLCVLHLTGNILFLNIALLDIDFDGAHYTGMDIARRLRSLRNDAIIIFVTNFIEYAPEGYEVQAFRYVLKRDIHNDLKPNLLLALDHLSKETLSIQINGEIISIPLDDILYLEVQQHNVTAVTRKQTLDKKQKEYSFYASLSELEERLEPLGFLRIHKSYLVNMKHLKKFQCREALLDNGITLRVGEKSYAEKKQKYLLWKGWQ